MTLLFALSLAWAHGGEDHGAPAAAPPSATGTRVSMSSTALDAVMAVDGTAGTAVLYLADAETSGPVSGSARATLTGPGTADIAFAASASPGVHTGAATMAPGTWAGSLIVETPAGTDLLSVSGLTLDAPHADNAASSPWWLWGLGAVALLGATAIVSLGGGYLLGRRSTAALALLVASVAAPRVLAHGGEDHGEAKAAAPAPGASLRLPIESQFLLGLRTQRAKEEAFFEQVRGFGNFVAAPGGAAEILAPASGTLRAPDGGFPRPGATVAAGEILAFVQELPGGADRAALAQARADAATQVAEAKAALSLAERDAAQVGALGDAISPREVGERAQTVEVARVALREAEAAARTLDSGTSFAIRAPLAGRLARASVHPGDGVEAGSPLFDLVADAGLWVVVSVPEADARGVVAGAIAQVVPASERGTVLPATVIDPGQTADPQTGLVHMTLALDGDGAFLPGMAVAATIAHGQPRASVVVPDDAVVEANGGFLVFVKTGPESFSARDIDPGDRAGTNWEVEAGLHPGERVVTDATYALKSLAGR